MQSMTGFGTGTASLGGGTLTVEARAVNHKHLDLRLRLPRELNEHSVFAEQLVRARLLRGRVDVSVTVQGSAVGGPVLDRDRARSVYAELSALAAELGHREAVPLACVTTVPEVFVSDCGLSNQAVREALTSAVTDALDGLDEMRRVEGAALYSALKQQLDRVSAHVGVLSAAAEPMNGRYSERVRQRLRSLCADTAGVDPTRLEQEVVFFVERSCVHEETVRLRSHVSQCTGLLQEHGGIGRKLDFLLQEMLREASTLCAKAPEAEVTYTAIALRVELEQMREQAQNLE